MLPAPGPSTPCGAPSAVSATCSARKSAGTTSPQQANLSHIKFDPIKLALGNIVVTHDIEKSARRALGSCVHFKQVVLGGQPPANIEAARAEAIRNVNALLILVAAAKKSAEALNLGVA